MKNKYIIFGLLAILIVVTGSYFIINRNNLFEKKLVCSRLMPDVQKKLTNDQDYINQAANPVGVSYDFIFLQIFYSPKLQTCVYAFNLKGTVDPASAPALKTLGYQSNDTNGYLLRDALTNQNIFDTKDQTEFNKKVTELSQ